MALSTATAIKANFETGDRPTAANFEDLIDTSNKFITAEAASATAPSAAAPPPTWYH